MVEGVAWGSWRWWNLAIGWREEKEKKEEKEDNEPATCGWRQRALHFLNRGKQGSGGEGEKGMLVVKGYGKKMMRWGDFMEMKIEESIINAKQETHEGV